MERKTRHLLTIAMMATLGKEHELAMHIRATANTGVTSDEVKEVFHQVAVYAGVPAANSAPKGCMPKWRPNQPAKMHKLQSKSVSQSNSPALPA